MYLEACHSGLIQFDIQNDSNAAIYHHHIGLGFALNGMIQPHQRITELDYYVFIESGTSQVRRMGGDTIQSDQDDLDEFVCIEQGPGNYKTFDSCSGFVDSGIPAAAGDSVRLIRDGSTVKAEYFRNDTWHSLYTFPSKTSANLFVFAAGREVGPNDVLVNPKGLGLRDTVPVRPAHINNNN